VKLVCSYCRTHLGDKPPLDDERVTHGMCPECDEHFHRQWSGLKLGEYLDAFDVPVAVVNEERRLVAANQSMADLIGKSQRDVFGLLGGEVMECVYARLEAGCGKVVHCGTCTIRRTVERTMATGESFSRVPAHVDQDGGRTHLVISTQKRDGVVELRIEDVQAPTSHATG
jgi:PAS domain-containing protein